MTNIINDVKIVFDYRSSSNWDDSAVLMNGEIGIVKLSSTDIRIKVGDGSTTFANLPWVSSEKQSYKFNEIENSTDGNYVVLDSGTSSDWADNIELESLKELLNTAV